MGYPWGILRQSHLDPGFCALAPIVQPVTKGLATCLVAMRLLSHTHLRFVSENGGVSISQTEVMRMELISGCTILIYTLPSSKHTKRYGS